MVERQNERPMNKEDYVSLEVANLLQEKGYPQEYNVGKICRLQNKANSLYEKTREITQSDIDNAWCIFNEVYPTLYEAAKWLRDKHKVYVSSLPTKECGKTIWYHQITKDVFSDGIYGTVSDEDFTSYEEALNEGILEALKLI